MHSHIFLQPLVRDHASAWVFLPENILQRLIGEHFSLGHERATLETDGATQSIAAVPRATFEDGPQLMMYADNARLRADAMPKQEQMF